MGMPIKSLLMKQGAGGGGGSQSFAWDPSEKAALTVLSSGDLLAYTEGFGTNGSYGARGTVAKNSGKWQFEVLINQLGVGSNRCVFIVGFDGNEATITTAATMSGGGVYSRSNTATLLFVFPPASTAAITPTTGKLWTQADIAGCTMDFSTKELSVYRNGVLTGSMIVTAMNTSLYTYRPCVKMGGNGPAAPTSALIQPGPLTYPVSGFSAWA